jgi:hypothetical protein
MVTAYIITGVSTMTTGPLPQGPYVTITCNVTCNDYYGPVPVDKDSQDDSTNPKMWAAWFREFLFDLFGWPVKHSIQFAKLVNLPIRMKRCRSAPIRAEWKMKLWKQRLVAA